MYDVKQKISDLLDVPEKMFIYVEKIGTPELLVSLREYLRDKKDDMSLNNYAYMLRNGLGGEKDPEMAQYLESFAHT